MIKPENQDEIGKFKSEGSLAMIEVVEGRPRLHN